MFVCYFCLIIWKRLPTMYLISVECVFRISLRFLAICRYFFFGGESNQRNKQKKKKKLFHFVDGQMRWNTDNLSSARNGLVFAWFRIRSMVSRQMLGNVSSDRVGQEMSRANGMGCLNEKFVCLQKGIRFKLSHQLEMWEGSRWIRASSPGCLFRFVDFQQRANLEIGRNSLVISKRFKQIKSSKIHSSNSPLDEHSKMKTSASSIHQDPIVFFSLVSVRYFIFRHKSFSVHWIYEKWKKKKKKQMIFIDYIPNDGLTVLLEL